MDKVIDDGRYLIYEQLQSIADGFLYSGRDIFLQRDVFLYIVQKTSSYDESFIQALSDGTVFSNSRFFHILNAGETEDAYYAVLTAWTGTPLHLVINEHTLSPQEVISEVLALGTSIMDAMEAGITGFNVTAENLWLTNEKKLYILDIWTKSDGEYSNVQGLSRLIYQLGVYSDHIPNDWEQKPSVPLPAFAEWNAKSAHALMNLAWLGYHGEHTLSSFMLELHSILEHTGVIVPSIPYKAAKSNKKLIEHFDAADAPLEPERSQETTESKDGALKNSLNRMMVLFTLVVAGILAGAMIWSNLPDRDVEQQSAVEEESLERGALQYENANDDAETAAEEGIMDGDVLQENWEALQPGEDQTVENEESVHEPDDPEGVADQVEDVEPVEPEDDGAPEDHEDSGRMLNGNNEWIDTPSLLGMTQKEAEQHALDSELRYFFRIEESEAEQGIVFMQQPEPGEPIAKGDRVTFWVSR